MKTTFVPPFNPDMMAPEALEAVFVQRHALAERLVEVTRESAVGEAKHYSLVIGPRGIGKTHLIALLYHRLKAAPELSERLVIAWTREEEWGVTSFFDLLLRILHAVSQETNDPGLEEAINSLYALARKPNEVEAVASEVLREFVGDRTLLVLMENLDDLMRALGETGQKRLRAYLQNDPFCTVIATAQSLFNEVSLQTSPFYGFFNIEHLEQLSIQDAIDLLAQIAKLRGDPELAGFITTRQGRARVRAIHLLAGGNHRIYVILSQFLSRQSLDELVEVFLATLDELTPFFQARMNYLSPQQRKMVDFLCGQRGAATVKDIAQGCFVTPQTASSQLGDLREKGYVRSDPLGRESYYELREPLMRLWSDVKRNRGEPIRLFVEFLRAWYTERELRERLQQLAPEASLDRAYVSEALHAYREEPDDLRIAACLRDHAQYEEAGDLKAALEVAEELVVYRGSTEDWLEKGAGMLRAGQHEGALAAFDEALALEPGNPRPWCLRGIALAVLARNEEAASALKKSVELDPENAVAWGLCGSALSRLGRHQEALPAYQEERRLAPGSASAWVNVGHALGYLGRYEEALAAFDGALQRDGRNPEAWYGKGLALKFLGQREEALAALDEALERDEAHSLAWAQKGVVAHGLGRYEEALAAFDKALELEPDQPSIWSTKASSLRELDRFDEALASSDRAAELEPENGLLWADRGVLLAQLDRMQDAEAAFRRACEVDPQLCIAWQGGAIVACALGRNEEALGLLARALELDSEDALSWHWRSEILADLGRHEEALASIELALSLEPDIGPPSGLLMRATQLLALGRWAEGEAALDDALHRLAQTGAGGAGYLVDELLARTADRDAWRRHIRLWIERFRDHGLLATLGAALVDSIPTLSTPSPAGAAVQAWRDLWHELGTGVAELEVALRLLDAAVRWRETEDPRVLLGLPAEERKLLNPLLGLEPDE